jgi:hypothetical protein
MVPTKSMIADKLMWMNPSRATVPQIRIMEVIIRFCITYDLEDKPDRFTAKPREKIELSVVGGERASNLCALTKKA